MVPVKQYLSFAFMMTLVASAGAQASPAPPSSNLNADAFRLPSSAYDTSKPYRGPAATTPEAFKPGQFDLGDASVLQFDARRTPPSGVGIEAIDPKRLGGIRRDDSKP